MNRKEFGHLIVALRKEHLDEDGKPWTRAKLAEATMLSELLLTNIENGRKVILETDILTKLADALQLTGGEREQLFLAASGIEQIAQNLDDPLTVFSGLVDVMEKVQSPAFILDPFADIVAANPMLPLLHDIGPEILVNPLVDQATQFNILRLVFSPEFEMQRKRFDNWDETALRVMMLFRVVSFRYRTHPYYQYLFRGLTKYPAFRKAWREERMPEFRFMDNLGFKLNHGKFGWINFMSNTVTAMTTAGDLKLYTFTALDEATTQALIEMNKMVGNKVFRLASWPDKYIPA